MKKSLNTDYDFSSTLSSFRDHYGVILTPLTLMKSIRSYEMIKEAWLKNGPDLHRAETYGRKYCYEDAHI